MPYTDPSSCNPINLARPTPILTPNGADWVICLDPGCEVEGVGLKAATYCLYSPQNPSDHKKGLPVVQTNATWGTTAPGSWYVDANNCLHVTRLKQKIKGVFKYADNSHVDVITCCPGPA